MSRQRLVHVREAAPYDEQTICGLDPLGKRVVDSRIAFEAVESDQQCRNCGRRMRLNAPSTKAD